MVRLVACLVAEGVVRVRVQGPLRLDPHNEPQPDLMLLVEVVDSSLAYDRGTKLALHPRHGVPEVGVIDLYGGAVDIYRSRDRRIIPNVGD